MKTTLKPIYLTQLHPGDNCKVNKICAGYNATRRLYEMGLNTGANIKVVKNDIGPIILSLSGNKIAIGRGLAEKIIVEN
ncbi:ferrous iron transport protein A [Schnuerera sp. xch1]|uniref:FeoA family protein n=1 Tax=Schnuerera sp. xch1 TaxID=2874283 RepID=UPI001CBEE27C|nr:FeoA family protein [Schnuerera sp. xch1]MBZ2175434.1 ferrous iron transport protein A [Schnuerera sp. xch1]